MKKIRLRICAFLMTLMVSMCSVTASFQSSKEICQAAALVPELTCTTLEILQWLFLSAGINFSVADMSSWNERLEEDAIKRFEEYVDGSCAPDDSCTAEDIKSQFKIVVDNTKSNFNKNKKKVINVSLNLWEKIKGFASSLSKEETSLTVTDGYDVVNYFSDYITNLKLDDNFYYFENSDDLQTVAEYCQKYGTENFSLYACWMASPSGTLHSQIAWVLVFGESATQLGDPFNNPGNTLYLKNNPQYDTPPLHALLFQIVDKYGRVQLTDFADIDSKPYTENIFITFDNIRYFQTIDYPGGYYSTFRTVCKNGIDSPTYEKQVARAVPHALAKNVIDEGNYDVITKGQTEVGKGNVTITIPDELTATINGINTRLDDINEAIAQIEAGNVSAGEILDQAGVVPVNTSTNESVYEYPNENNEEVKLALDQILERLDAMEENNPSEDIVTNPEPQPDDATQSNPEDLKIEPIDYMVDLRLLFPFCIPFDIYDMLSAFVAEPLAPYWEMPFSIPRLGIDESFVIDLSKFESVRDVLCKLQIVGYMLMLAWGTSKVIKW